MWHHSSRESPPCMSFASVSRPVQIALRREVTLGVASEALLINRLNGGPKEKTLSLGWSWTLRIRSRTEKRDGPHRALGRLQRPVSGAPQHDMLRGEGCGAPRDVPFLRTVTLLNELSQDDSSKEPCMGYQPFGWLSLGGGSG